MGKGTNKKVMHGIFIVFTVIFALVTSLYVAIRDTTVQSMIARTVAGVLSKKLNTEVLIKTFYITPRLVMHVEDVRINDLQHYNLLTVGELESSMAWQKESKMFYVRTIKLKDFFINIVKYEGFDNLNIKDLINELGSGKKKRTDKDLDMQFFVSDLELENGRVVYWNQNKDKPEKISMDYLHLDIQNINMKAKDLSYKSDTIQADVLSLSGFDKCGFTIDDFSGHALVCPTETSVLDLKLLSHATDASMDLTFKYNDYPDYLTFIDSVYIIADIRPSQLTLSDLKYFSVVMSQMPDTLQINGRCEGYVSDFSADDFNFSFGENTHFTGDLSFIGLPDFFSTNITADIKNMMFSYDDLENFFVPYIGRLPIPDMLSSMCNGSLSGYFNGYPKDFNTSMKINTVKGAVDFECAFNCSNAVTVPGYHASVFLDSLDITEMLSLKYPFVVDMNLNIGGMGLDKKTADLEMVANIGSVTFMNNTFHDIHLHADFENQKLITSTDIKSPILDLELDGLLNLQYAEPAMDVYVDINNADLYKLNILNNDSIMSLTAKVSCNVVGDDFNTLVGSLDIDSVSYRCSSGSYKMDALSVNISNDDYMLRNINVLCDFFDIELSGIIDPYTFNNSFRNYILNYFYVPSWIAKGKTFDSGKQDFNLYVQFKDTRPLTDLFIPTLKIKNGSSLRLSFLSDNNRLNSTFISDEIVFAGVRFENVSIFNRSGNRRTYAEVNFNDVILRDSSEKNPDALGLENVKMRVDLENDTLFFNMNWDNMNDTDKGQLASLFVIEDKHHSRFSIDSSNIMINGRTWVISDSCFVDFFDDKMYVNSLNLSEGTQFIDIEGFVPRKLSDTLEITFNNFDISILDLVTKGYGFDFDGFIDGSFRMSGITEKLTFLSNLNIKDVFLNKEKLGNINLMANWNAVKSSIYIDANVVRDDKKVIDLTGNYYLLNDDDNLRFNLFVNDFDLNVISPFVSTVISEVKGGINGVLSISGTPNKPVIEGGIGFKDAGCRVNYLNNYYTFSHVVNLSRNLIKFENLRLTDVNNNTAVANGTITHDYLKNFVFDINIDCYNFFALNIPEEKANGFYGTAVADGVVSIKGPLNDIKMDINAITKKGTEIDIPLTNTEVVNDDFIVFVYNGENQSDTVAVAATEPVKKQNFTMNLNADVNPAANVRISLPMNIGVITANGNGNLRMGYKSGDLSLIGDYMISEGEFVFTIQNLIKMDFVLRGGTITWSGDITDADIDVVGSYRTNALISSLGIETDSTSVGEKVNVDCIIRLKDKLMNPTITFSLELPNANDDIKNTVFSMVDTTNQSVVTQQVFSLLMLGSFSYSSADVVSQFGTTTYYNVLTNQLSNWLSQISKDLDVGVRYTPGSDINKEELKVALRTKFFDDRLTIEGNFGMITESSSSANYTNNVVGDVDITFRISNRFSLKAYNHSNINSNYYSYSFENYSDYTQGVGISYSQSFDKVSEIFTRRKRSKDKKNKN